ncbi:MAG: GlsB/YeaQ/YmgE family stress response membrane protein [Actinobacteria bacterium]|nr:GlsB/YeaQ/YmgE family stress response membrane protein [Actinomycetota bacterium]
MLWFIIVLLVVGVIFGAIARLVVPGPDPMSLVGTWALGVVGSLVGGFLGYAIFGADIEDGAVQAGGIVSSIVGAIIVLLIYRAVSNRNTAH